MKEIYKGIIIKENGKIKDILYLCDKVKNKKCKKTYCGIECNHTLEEKYAIDFSKEKDIQVKETNVYVEGKLIRKIIEYK